MTVLFTARLRLLPLSVDDLKIGICNKSKMDLKLGLVPTGIPFSQSIREVLRIKIDKIQRDPDNRIYYTFWQIILVEKNCSIGEVCFAGPPSSNGEIEVGYYIDPQFQCRGYMTEALKAMTCWGLSQTGVTCIKARTTKTNYPSHKVLRNAGFKLYLKESFYWWILRR